MPEKDWLKIDILSKLSASQANFYPKLKFVYLKVWSLSFKRIEQIDLLISRGYIDLKKHVNIGQKMKLIFKNI